MKNFYKKTINLLCIITLAFSSICLTNADAAQVTTKTIKTTTINNCLSVSPLTVVNNPNRFLNKTISFNAEFVSYSALGLDYKPAYKDPKEYISILIKREDVQDHVIPLSEMKIFLKRKIAEKHMDLEQGDKIRITGKVFSTALGDPWIDIAEITVLEKAPKKENK